MPICRLGRTNRCRPAFRLVLFCLLAASAAWPVFPAARPAARDNPSPTGKSAGTEPTLSVVLGCPTSSSVMVSILASTSLEGYLEYGPESGPLDAQTAVAAYSPGLPATLAVEGLQPDMGYAYRFRCRATGETAYATAAAGQFHTQRPAGGTFRFTVQADTHVGDTGFVPDLCRQTLRNVQADAPDFHIDLGDTFLTEKLAGTVEEEEATFTAFRQLLAATGPIAPLFLVNGNHEGELGWKKTDSADNQAVRSTLNRRKYYPCPAPGGFYTGSGSAEAGTGVRDGYYAWTWGNALFIVLDPFWYTTRKPNGTSIDNWGWTLGQEQYEWLKSTLESSGAAFKFVFTHHLTGGVNPEARGGVETAPFYEWGGRNADGSLGFDSHRPGWPLPVHELLKANGVNIVFHGHDHFFARQVLDGIVYQECPRPSFRQADAAADAAAAGYTAGDILPSPGHLRIEVSPDQVRVDYVRATVEGQSGNGGVVYSYTIPDRPDAFSGNAVLGCPTSSSIRLNLYTLGESGDVIVQYGTASSTYSAASPPEPLPDGTPLEIALEGLSANTKYYYRLLFRRTGAEEYTAGPESSFRTARLSGDTFTFCVQGDSHPERENSQFDPGLYTRTLLTAEADNPDFYILSGDDFSVDTLDPATVTEAAVVERYALQRPYLGLIGRSAPLFLVNGNHEQAARYLLDGTPDNVAVWAQNARNRFYPQPAPDAFYTGNSETVPSIGLLRNYFAWTWGDALFLVIDPYWGSSVCVDNPFDGGPKHEDMWDATLGEAQYRWFQHTLEQSRARYKFVFAHHVNGTGRGGVEVADRWEWGGHNPNGSWAFPAERPGWTSPIHELMVANGVTVFFQGHDHIWARQEKDGVIYQTLPEPADSRYAFYNQDAFLSGDLFPNSGYTRVTVSPSGGQVEYVRTWLPADESPGQQNGTVAFSYPINPADVPVTVCGDIDGSGSVDGADLLLLADGLAANTPLSAAALSKADLDGSGTLDSLDLSLLLSYLSGRLGSLSCGAGK